MVSEKKNFSHYKSIGTYDPSGVANLDPRGMVGRIYVGDHLTLLHTKSVSSEPQSYSKNIFKGSLAILSTYTYDPLECGQFGPQGLVWQDLRRGLLKHCYILNI